MLILIFGAIHFGLSMLATAKGFFIFRTPSTASEIFWQGAMNVLLFPASVLFRGPGTRWEQTLAVVANSLAWGGVFAGLYLQVRRLRAKRSNPPR